MRDWIDSGKSQSAVILRYFKQACAHESGRIGGDPNDIPKNLIPFISQVAVGRRNELAVFGDEYETRDVTVERDYSFRFTPNFSVAREGLVQKISRRRRRIMRALSRSRCILG